MALAIECLRCGTKRLARRTVWRRLESPECPQCGYLGWAPVLELAESEPAKRPAGAGAPGLLRPVA